MSASAPRLRRVPICRSGDGEDVELDETEDTVITSQSFDGAAQPSHTLPAFVHRLHDGYVSSHFTCLALSFGSAQHGTRASAYTHRHVLQPLWERTHVFLFLVFSATISNEMSKGAQNVDVGVQMMNVKTS